MHFPVEFNRPSTLPSTSTSPSPSPSPSPSTSTSTSSSSYTSTSTSTATSFFFFFLFLTKMELSRPRQLLVGLFVLLFLSRWIPLVLLVLLGAFSLLALILGCLLAVSFLSRKSFNRPFHRDLPRLSFVDSWLEISLARTNEKVTLPKRPLAQTQSIRIRYILLSLFLGVLQDSILVLLYFPYPAAITGNPPASAHVDGYFYFFFCFCFSGFKSGEHLLAVLS